MLDSILEVFRCYQTFFTGLLGFSGVIITMIVNARTQRNLEEQRIAHDRRTIKAALKAELEANRNTYQGRISQFSEGGSEHDALLPSRVVDDVYRTHLDKLGLLTEEEIEKVINAYLLIVELPYRLRILVGTNNVQGYQGEFIRLPADKVRVAKELHESFLPGIVAAIESIDNQVER